MNTCYVIDDDYYSIKVLSGYIAKMPDLKLIGSSLSPLQAIHDINERKDVDIVFLDIDMPELSGLDVADMIAPSANIIFTTAHDRYAVRAFEKNGYDFLLKPISFERFIASVTKVKRLINTGRTSDNLPDCFFINPGVKGKLIRLDYSEILYIEALKNYIIIYTPTDKHITYSSMKEVESAVPDTRFVRIHKSYIVNIEKIKLIDGNMVVLPNEVVLPMGPLFKNNLIRIIDAITLGGGRKSN
jgi:DNA-binding LytR/AlgR family response regulator